MGRKLQHTAMRQRFVLCYSGCMLQVMVPPLLCQRAWRRREALLRPQLLLALPLQPSLLALPTASLLPSILS